MEEHLELNRASWDERVDAHVASPGYAVRQLIDEPGFLSGVVTFDRPRLGDVAGLRGVHLQCHIGTDTVSLAKLGARMTGLDFSPPAVEAAQRLAADCGVDADFVCAEFHDALSALEPGTFDFVYTGIGALCWLPKIDAWAEIVARLLKPGGRLFVREGHPMLWTIDERVAAAETRLPIEYHYFETDDGLRWTEEGSYVETDRKFAHNTTISFNHGLGEIFTALLDRGMTITQFVEHDSVPWEAIEGGAMTADEIGEWRLNDRPERLPMSYTLQAVKAR